MHPLIQTLRSRGLDPEGDIPPDLPLDDATEVSSEAHARALFIAIKGTKADGHRYLGDADARGCRVALVTEIPADAPKGMALVKVNDTRRAASIAAHAIAGDPSRAMDVFGVTGTNGKTTTVFLMEAILKAAGRRPGIMGTVVTRWPKGERVHEEPAGETTPSGPRIARLMKKMRADGVDAAAFEVSSHAIDQRRVEGVRFRACALTNVTQDHLDYHESMEAYRDVKLSLFERMLEENPDAVGVANVDDEAGRMLADRLPAANRITFSVEGADADLRASAIWPHDDGTNFDLEFRGETVRIRTPIHGRFNVQNILTAAGLALAGGVPLDVISLACATFRGAPGRFELIGDLPGVKIIVDYAHTPDAVRKLLENARPLATGRLIAVFGCGGDRDNAKRPLMGRAAAELADSLIVTNDNPRTEDPGRIVQMILEGIPRDADGQYAVPLKVIHDRGDAIAQAVQSSREGDVVVIAGKGHEDYQILGSKKVHFDDREEARKAIGQIRGVAEATTKDIKPGADVR